MSKEICRYLLEYIPFYEEDGHTHEIYCVLKKDKFECDGNYEKCSDFKSAERKEKWKL